MKKNSDHIIINDMLFYCLSCGASYKMELPIPIDEFAKKAKAFIKLHIDCKTDQNERD